MTDSGPVDTSLLDTRRVGEITGLSRSTISSFVAAGFVSPVRQQGDALGFSFQDLVLLRTAQALREAHLPTRRILQALAKLRDDLPDAMPLTGLQICAVGDVVTVREGDAAREVESGQWLLQLDNAAVGNAQDTTAQRPDDFAGPRNNAALHWFDRAMAYEHNDVAQAESAYRKAIALDPCFEDAYVNLAAMLCESHRCDEAIALCQQGTQQCEDAPLIHFNLAVALEDQGLSAEAVRAYASALRCDPFLADAHFNIAALLEGAGDSRGALRHLNAYRRLQHRALRLPGGPAR